MKMKSFYRGTAFFLIGFLLFIVVQEVLSPEWNDVNATKSAISGMYALEDNSVDVLFVGTSHVGLGISPMKLYEDTGIKSYNLGTASQPIEAGYFLLKEAFKTQSPKVVFLDASRMFEKTKGGSEEAGYRYVMDNLKMSINRIQMAMEYEKIVDNTGFWSGVFPIIRFHSRWSQLNERDFNLWLSDRPYYTMGQYIATMAIPAPSLESTETSVTNRNQMGDGRLIVRENGTTSTILLAPPYYQPEAEDRFVEYVSKIKALCDQNDAQLVLMKVPVTHSPLTSGWNSLKSDIASELAAQNDIPFLDLMYADVIDESTDSDDGGVHLNIRGAEKVTAYLGKYLRDNYNDLNTEGSLAFDEALDAYREVRDIGWLQSERDFSAFLEQLIEHKENLTIYFSSYDEYSSGLTDEDYALLQQLGLKLIDDGKHGDGYAAIIENGVVVYEGLSDRGVEYTTILGDKQIELTGSGIMFSELGSNIEVNKEEYSLARRGLNIMIWDNETDIPLHCVNFDTYSEEKPMYCTSNNVHSFFRDYEEIKCIK